MRKIITILLLIGINKVYSQFPNSYTISTSVTPDVYKARQIVTALPGAVLSPSASQNSIMRIDPGIQVANTYTGSVNVGGGTGPMINTSLKVGTLEGIIDVSNYGSAGYTMPISLPPGTNQLMPQINVSYNQGFSEDYMGLGWSIGGLSSIRAVNKTIFLNGATGPIKLDGSDQYALDGNNLILTTNGYYRLENDNYSKITKYSTYFKVETKNGLIIEYGNSDDSKYSGALTNYEFFINKIYDSYGNYVLFEYDKKTSHNEIKIKKISYTGNANANIPAYNSINFYYNTKQKSERKFVAGELILQSLILRQIEINAELTGSCKYDFTYSNSNNHNYLNQIDFYDYDGNKLNPLVFKYGSSTPITSPCGSLVNSSGFTQCVKTMSNNADVAQGDFNGDGRSDVILFKYSSSNGIYDAINHRWNKNYIGYEVIFSNGLTTSTGSSGFSETLPSGYSINFAPAASVAALPSAFSPLFPDIDGDGRSEMILLKNSSSSSIKIVEAYQLNSANSGFIRMPNSFELYNFQQFTFADYDGDGRQEALIYQIDNSTIDHHIQVFDFNSGQFLSSSPSGYTVANLGSSTYNFRGLSAIDINGDGKDEISTVINNRAVLLSFNVNSFEKIWEDAENFQDDTPGSFIPKQDYYGDFNGDGILDVVRVRKGIRDETTEGAGLYYGSGKGFYRNPSDNYEDSPGFSDVYKKYLAADINGDKKTDLVEINSSYCVNNNGIILKVYYWDADNLNTKIELGSLNGYLAPVFYEMSVPSPSYDFDVDGFDGIDAGWNPDVLGTFLAGDYNGDGRDDIMVEIGSSKYGSSCQSTINSNSYFVFSLKPFSTEYFLSEVYDGYGRKQSLTYESSAKQATPVYNTTLIGASVNFADNLTNGINKFKNQMWLVSATQTPNGIGGITTNTYSYQGGLTHRLGKNFLGFDKVTSVNTTTGYTTEKNFTINSANYLDRLLTGTTTKLTSNSAEIANQTNTYLTINYGGKIHHVYQNKQTTKDFITSFKTVSEISKDNDGNIISSIKSNYNSTGATSFITQEKTESSNFVANGAWLPSLPQNMTVTLSRQGEVNYVRNTTITYTPEGKSDVITYDPMLDKKVVVNNDYYPSGALSQTETSAPGGGVVAALPTKLVKFQYDPRQRFITKTINPLNQESNITYDLRFGAPTTEKDISGLVTTFSYDGLGRLIKKRTPDNIETNIVYQWAINDPVTGVFPIPLSAAPLYSVKTTTQGAPETKVFYDMFNRTVKTETDVFSQKIHSSINYDARGNIYQSTGNYYGGSSAYNTVISENLYDDYNRIFQTISNDGSTSLLTTYSYTTTTGTYITTVTFPDEKKSKTGVDCSGKIVSTLDNANNTVAYNYYANGKTKSVSLNGAQTEAYEYDELGRPNKLTEPNSGITLYDYDAYGLLRKSTDARNKTFETDYDVLDRPTQTQSPGEGNYTYTYYTNGNGLNLPKTETSPAGVVYEYVYDYLNRIITKKSTIAGQLYTNQYTYDNNSNLLSHTLPGGFKILNEYNALGFLKKIKRGDNGQLIWQADEYTPFGNYNKYTLGNGVQTAQTFNNFGILEHKTAAGIQDYSFITDLFSGNITGRNENLKPLSETFEYNSQLNRLEKVTQGGIVTQQFSYKPNNDIASKTGIGPYVYDPVKINQLSTAPNTGGIISPVKQIVAYTNFSKVSHIEQGQQVYDITYGPDKQRAKSVLTNSSTGQTRSRIYLPSYEKETRAGNYSIEVNYISSPEGLCAMYVNENGTYNMYYVYTDHLGSINTITDNTGNIVYEQNFDAWGRNRNVNNWSYDNITAAPNWLWRGFTGHEHLPQFDLIDMNGRMYDPVVSQFLSVDPLLSDYSGQSPYNYALNNPMSNADPSGLGVENKVLIDMVHGLQTYIEDANGEDFVSYHFGHYKDGGFITDIFYTEAQYFAYLAKNKVPVQETKNSEQIYKDREVWRQYGENFNELADRSEQFIIGTVIAGGAIVSGGVVAAEYGVFAGGVTTAAELKTATKFVSAAANTSSQGFKSLGAAGKGFSEVLLKGGQAIKNSTWKRLGIDPIKGGEAIHGLKKANNLKPNFHGKIMGNGDYLHPETGEFIDNIFDYLH